MLWHLYLSRNHRFCCFELFKFWKNYVQSIAHCIFTVKSTLVVNIMFLRRNVCQQVWCLKLSLTIAHFVCCLYHSLCWSHKVLCWILKLLGCGFLIWIFNRPGIYVCVWCEVGIYCIFISWRKAVVSTPFIDGSSFICPCVEPTPLYTNTQGPVLEPLTWSTFRFACPCVRIILSRSP